MLGVIVFLNQWNCFSYFDLCLISGAPLNPFLSWFHTESQCAHVVLYNWNNCLFCFQLLLLLCGDVQDPIISVDRVNHLFLRVTGRFVVMGVTNEFMFPVTHIFQKASTVINSKPHSDLWFCSVCFDISVSDNSAIFTTLCLSQCT